MRDLYRVWGSHSRSSSGDRRGSPLAGFGPIIVDEDMAPTVQERVRAIETPMLDQASEFFFEGGELESLRVVIRLTVEFADYLEHVAAGSPWRPKLGSDQEQAEYAADSVFSGISSFAALSICYRGLPGATQSTVLASQLGSLNLKEDFAEKYRQLLDGPAFEGRCRLLLDLFKLQIVFAGLTYR